MSLMLLTLNLLLVVLQKFAKLWLRWCEIFLFLDLFSFIMPDLFASFEAEDSCSRLLCLFFCCIWCYKARNFASTFCGVADLVTVSIWRTKRFLRDCRQAWLWLALLRSIMNMPRSLCYLNAPPISSFAILFSLDVSLKQGASACI